MRKAVVLALVSLVLFTSYLPVAAFATFNLHPAQTTSCPTYLTNLLVDFVNSSPIQITVGDVVTTTFHVVYPDGTPVQLVPQTASFLWVGAAGQKEFDNVQVEFTGNPGYYNYTQNVTTDVAQATVGSSGTGKITVEVGFCSCSDALGNRGPTGNIGSDETLTPSDNSNLNAGPPPSTPNPFTYIVPIIIAILVILAILLFLRRSRGKKKK
ncbi:MAG: hypothetical protein ABSC50_07205 [Candidatus Bathyarchaeia archaeon]